MSGAGGKANEIITFEKGFFDQEFKVEERPVFQIVIPDGEVNFPPVVVDGLLG